MIHHQDLSGKNEDWVLVIGSVSSTVNIEEQQR